MIKKEHKKATNKQNIIWSQKAKDKESCIAGETTERESSNKREGISGQREERAQADHSLRTPLKALFGRPVKGPTPLRIMWALILSKLAQPTHPLGAQPNAQPYCIPITYTIAIASSQTFEVKELNRFNYYFLDFSSSPGVTY